MSPIAPRKARNADAPTNSPKSPRARRVHAVPTLNVRAVAVEDGGERGAVGGSAPPLSLRTIFLVAVPLLASFLLLVGGIVAITVVNSYYAAEEATSYPQQLAVSMASFLKKEVEAELRHAPQTYRALSSAVRSGAAGVPVEDYVNPRRVMQPSEPDSPAFFAASGGAMGSMGGVNYNGGKPFNTRGNRLNRAMTGRREWQRQSGADSARWFGARSHLTYVLAYYTSHAQYTWVRNGEGGIGTNLGVTFLGEDVALGEYETDAWQFHVEYYRSSRDVSSDSQYNASPNVSSTVRETVPFGTYSMRRMQFDWAWGRFSSEELGFEYRGVPLKQRKTTHYFTYMMVYNYGTETYDLKTCIMGSLRDSAGRLVGAVEVTVGVEGLQRSIQRVAAKIAALNPSAPSPRYANHLSPSSPQSTSPRSAPPYQTTSFVMTPEGYVVASSGDVSPLHVVRTNYDPYNRPSWNAPPTPRNCQYATSTMLNGTTIVYLLCNHLPSELGDEDPLMAAAAPHLPALCKDSSPLLGTGGRVRMRVRWPAGNGGYTEEEDGNYVIVCDAVDAGAPPAITANFTSWRVVSIVSEKELVDSLVSDLVPAAVKIGAAGAAVAFAAIAVALAVSIYVQRRAARNDEAEPDERRVRFVITDH